MDNTNSCNSNTYSLLLLHHGMDMKCECGSEWDEFGKCKRECSLIKKCRDCVYIFVQSEQWCSDNCSGMSEFKLRDEENK